MAALTIKNEEVVRLAKQLSALEGERLTAVVIASLQDRLESLNRPRISEERAQYLLDWGKRIRARESPESLVRDPVDDLCDEVTGLPK